MSSSATSSQPSMSLRRSPMVQWSVEDVCEWLKREGYGSFVAEFSASEIDGEMLADMTLQDLDEIIGGGASKGAKKRSLMKSIENCDPSLDNSSSSKRGEDEEKEVELRSRLTAREVSEWLSVNRLDVFVAPFLRLDVCGEMLLDIESDDLDEIGVGNKPQRSKLLALLGKGETLSDAYHDSSGTISSRCDKASACDIRLLDVDGVSNWLRTIGMSRFVDSFEHLEIDGEMLADLGERDLEELNVGTRAERSSLLRAIESSLLTRNDRCLRHVAGGGPLPKEKRVGSDEEEEDEEEEEAEKRHSIARSLKSLSVDEFRAWLAALGFEEFARAFWNAEIHGDMAQDLQLSDAEDFPSLHEETWPAVLKAISGAANSGVVLPSTASPPSFAAMGKGGDDEASEVD
eukprot:g1611.t1